MALTETKIKALPFPEKDTLVSDGNNLYLRLSPSGRKTWVYLSQTDWVRRKRKLGTWPALNVAQARAKAAMLSAAADVHDVVKVEAAVGLWLERVIMPRYKRTQNIDVYARLLVEQFGHRPVDLLTTRELVDSLGRYGVDTPVAANRCRTAWSLFFGYAVERGWATNNPLANTTNRIAGGIEKPRDRVLTDAEIKWVMNLDHANGPLLRALLLTGCRISELQAAKVHDIENETLHIPSTKNGKPHWVHITPQLRVEFMQWHKGWIFKSRGATAVQAWLRRLGMTWTPHDLRRTFATRLAGSGVAPHIVEKLLNHQMQGVMATYNRHDYETERRAAAEAWSAELVHHIYSKDAERDE